MKLIKTNIRSNKSISWQLIKIWAASIDEFDPIPAIYLWNVAGVIWPQNENDSEDENTWSDDNHNDDVVN